MKRRKRRHQKLWTALFLLLLCLVLAASINIRTITITGNKKYSPEQIEALLFDGKWSKNSLYSYYQSQFQPHKQIPFIEGYEILFQNPVSVEVIVYEKTVVGYVSYMSSYMYFDKDGIIVESSNSKLEGVPLVTGLEFGQIVLNRPLPVKNQQIFERVMNLTQILSVFELQTDRIHYDEHGNVTLSIDEIEVYLGDNLEMNGKISRLADMLPELSGMAGTLYLDSYDENNADKWYSFIPAADRQAP